jgi:glycosyltransferase involved in cell wall biosynthesis
MNLELPLVCVCVPTYNAASTVGETLKSILEQTYTNLVVHVSDNASTDETLKVVEAIADERISIHIQNENIGGEGNFTKCIQMATGKYTVIFHADDIYEPTMLAKQVDFLEKNPDVGAVFTGARTIDENGKFLGTIGRAPGQMKDVVKLDFKELMRMMLLHHNFLVCPSVMVRTEIYRNEIREWGGSSFLSASDIDMWLQLASKRPIAILGQQLMRYRISSAQFSESIRNRTERTDFFLVLDSYLARPEVLNFITTDDLRHYGWLERHEKVARALNLFVLGRSDEVKGLLSGLFCWDAVYAAIMSRRGLVTLAAGGVLRIILIFGSNERIVNFIKKMRRNSWR